MVGFKFLLFLSIQGVFGGIINSNNTIKAGDNLISIIIGGLGAGVGSEVITKTGGVCSGENSSPQIAGASFSSNNGWVAAVYNNHVAAGEAGDLLLCGGKVLDESDICHRLKLGEANWKPESSKTCNLDRERTYAAMFTTFDGKVVVSGGYSGQAGWLSDVQQLDSYESDCEENCCQWTNIGTINGRGVYSHCALQYDDDHYVFLGGNTYSSEGQYDIADVQIYNFKTGQWKQGQDMPIPRQSLGCIKTTHNGREGILIAGGFCNNNPNYEGCNQLRISQTAFYDFQADSWEVVGDLNQARDGLVLANIEGTIMAIGGEYRGGPIQQIEAWDGERWEDSGLSLIQGTSFFAHAQVPNNFYTC